ncbi:hypothetical protein [Chryseobacterium soldanellicola]|uniref:hypothetical protein n=1 Tax=Chryseobacterium soldanellicola TaxID=311333 RepID=UPI00147FA503|nr:hypothetical protein [Chryseobacterium soldanellicola]
MGTTDNQPLVFKINNIEKLRITEGNRFIPQGITGTGNIWDKNLFFGGGVEGTTTGNTVFGLGSLTLNTTGNGNTAFGNNVLSANTTGTSNTGVGLNALISNTSGIQNVAIGQSGLNRLTTGNLNTALGFNTLYGGGASTITGDNNTGIGGQALQGLWVGASNNTVLGAKSFLMLRTGNNNIAIGYNNAASSEIANANNNIYIGNNIQPVSATPNNELNIGNWIVGNNGTIGIGSFSTVLPANGIGQDGEKYKLFVKDGIKTERVKVDVPSTNGWADYVFVKGYKLNSLEEIEKHIQEKGHLPNIPSADEVVKNGINLGEMDAKLLEKIEELTLYSIDQNKQIKSQGEQLKQQTEELKELKNQIQHLLISTKK